MERGRRGTPPPPPLHPAQPLGLSQMDRGLRGSKDVHAHTARDEPCFDRGEGGEYHEAILSALGEGVDVAPEGDELLGGVQAFSTVNDLVGCQSSSEKTSPRHVGRSRRLPPTLRARGSAQELTDGAFVESVGRRLARTPHQTPPTTVPPAPHRPELKNIPENSAGPRTGRRAHSRSQRGALSCCCQQRVRARLGDPNKRAGRECATVHI